MRATALAVLAAAGLSACASSQQAASASTDVVPTGAIQYDGQFRPIQQNDGRMGMQTTQRIYGSVRAIFRESTGRAQIRLELNTNANNSEVLTWSVAPGRCGSGSVPLAPAAQFPPLELSNNGRGDVNVPDIGITMPRGSYHVNVYRGGETLSNVIACANLTPRAAE